MSKTYKYSLESVIEADKNGELFQWAQDSLRGEGWNSGLANHLVEEKPVHHITFSLLKKRS